MTLYYPPPAPVRQTRFVAAAWVSFALGLAGSVLIPVPILNNAGALMGVAGFVIGIVAMFGTRAWLGLAGFALSGVAIVGTIVIQKHWSDELDRIRDDFDRDMGQISRDMEACSDAWEQWDPGSGQPPPSC